jgi:hypothetical protein
MGTSILELSAGGGCSGFFFFCAATGETQAKEKADASNNRMNL